MNTTIPTSAPTTIPPAELAALQAEGRGAKLIDVRTPFEFAEVHIPGAQLVPLNRLDPHALLQSRPFPEQPIYLICKSGARAAKAQQRFIDAGFSDAICVDGGIDAWTCAGLPVARGRKVISLIRQVQIVAGLLILAGFLLGTFVSPLLYILCAFVGAGLVFAGVTNTCGMALLLAKLPWNQGAACERPNH